MAQGRTLWPAEMATLGPAGCTPFQITLWGEINVPNIETFQYLYVMDGTPPGNLTVNQRIEFNTIVQESGADGDGLNDSTAVGQLITFAGATSRLLGITSNGEPIVAWNQTAPPYTNIQLGSNNPLLPPVTAYSSGPYLFCFAGDTEIATPDGFAFVQDLAIGDTVQTADGRTVPVKWIGRQTQHRSYGGADKAPVRIQAGALGEGLPCRDLTVTADHGMILDGLVISASALVNGTTIQFVRTSELPDTVTYYHVETEEHDVILANGAASETFVDVIGRRAFDNYREYLDLYGAERFIPEMHRPRITAQRLLPDAVRARLGLDIELQCNTLTA